MLFSLWESLKSLFREEVILSGLLSKNIVIVAVINNSDLRFQFFSMQIKVLDVHISLMISWSGHVRALQGKES